MFIHINIFFSIKLCKEEKQPYLEAVHLGRTFGEDYPGQQEEKRVNHQAIHRLSIQEQAGLDTICQRLRLLENRNKNTRLYYQSS